MEPGTSGEHAITRSGMLARATMATVLIVGATTALAITSLIPTDRRATAQSQVVTQQVAAQFEPTMPSVPTAVPLDSGEVGPFAFGFLVFDWDPAAPGGVPGFDSWPPGSRR